MTTGTTNFLAGLGADNIALIVSHFERSVGNIRAHLPPTDPHI
jgi:hypothetical protein